jgi:hypothetical protein
MWYEVLKLFNELEVEPAVKQKKQVLNRKQFLNVE